MEDDNQVDDSQGDGNSQPQVTDDTSYAEEATPTPDTNENDPATPTATTPRPNFLAQNWLITLSIVIFAFNGFVTLSTYVTSSYAFAETASGVVFCGGLLAALLLGAGVAKMVLDSSNTTNQDTNKGHANSYTIAGIVLLIASMIGGILTLVPGLILMYIGSKKPLNQDRKPISPTGRIFLAIVSFFGAGIAGLVITIFLTVITSTRACELSSSKCY